MFLLSNSRRARRTTRAFLHVEKLESRLAPCVDAPVSHESLRLDHDHCVSDLLPAFQGASANGTGEIVALGDNPSLIVPAYSSLPGARVTLYLDFNGHFDATWGSYSNVDTPAYDIDGNAASFSSTELTNIYKTWQYVAEDFAPFNVNVTTVEPGSFANGIALRVAIGGSGVWAGGGSGGISYINSFTNSIVNTAYVFPTNLGNGNPRYVADAASHEAGHAFGLRHQSGYNGTTKTSEYQSGPGDGTAPLMGNSYSTTRSLWWYGPTTSSTTFQNDVTVLSNATNGFGFRVDDHGNSVSTATALIVSASGAISGAGVIEQMTDVDAFSFTTAGGTVTLTVDVPNPYNNLDAMLELRDQNGVPIASADPSTAFDATLTVNLSAGSYRLMVRSHGVSANATSNNYGFNVGQYQLIGTIVPDGGSTAPTAPSGLSGSAPSASSIRLGWVDNSGNEDGFKIERLQGSTWTQVAVVGVNVTTWQDTGLTAATTYSYRVRAYNGGGDSAYSNTASATTQNAPAVPAAPTALQATVRGRRTLSVGLTWLDNASNESGYRVQRSADGGVTWTQVAQLAANATSYTDRAVVAGRTYSYRVLAYNGAGNSAFSNAVTITVVRGGSSGGPTAAPSLGKGSSESWSDRTTENPPTRGTRENERAATSWLAELDPGHECTLWKRVG
jgi:hypothetical protein